MICTPAQHPVTVPPRRRLRLSAVITAIAALALAAPLTGAADDDAQPAAKLDFARQIQPIFAKHCYACHGPDKQKGGLRLDDREAALRGGDSGKIILPGNAEESEIIFRVSGEEPEFLMPPKGDVLSDLEVDLLHRWIEQGAAWPAGASSGKRRTSDHWSFQPIERPAPPQVKQQDWPRNPIDRFVLAKLESNGIAPSPKADRYTLIRRVWLDVLGLLPSIEEVDTFVNDTRDDAYERMVERALASKHYGERWGRHWLDGARYADSDGYAIDGARSMWPYRDWVIAALNADMPFDRFTIEQLAGDLLENSTQSQLVATGFHRNTHVNQEGGTKADEFRVKATYDRVDTTGQVWLGLTIGCAQCHTHKFDPISQREYFQFYAFFNSAADANSHGPQVKIKPAGWDEREEKLRERIAAAEQALRAHDEQASERQAAWELTMRKRLAGGGEPIEWSKVKYESTAVARQREAADAGGDARDAGVTFTQQPDNSLLVGGRLAENEDYVIELATGLRSITGLRLDVLPDKRLPRNGPGLAGNGNFVLSGVELRVDDEPAAWAGAHASHGQPGYPIAHAIDGKDDTGWAINVGGDTPDGVKMNQHHVAYFVPATPVAVKPGQRVTVVLKHQRNANYHIGRFKLSLTGAEGVTVNRLAGAKADEALVEALSTPRDKRSKAQRELVAAEFRKRDGERQPLVRRVDELKKQLADMDKSLPSTMVMRELDSPRTTHVHIRGDFLRPGDEVTAAVPEVLPPLPDEPVRGERFTRLDLARWLVAQDNPLTARVTMNRVWMRYFGRGLVETEEDFGTQGTPPTHPQLLDWLASEFRSPRLDASLRGRNDGGDTRGPWSLKAMHRLILTSATYRQSSRHRPELRNVDPANRLLARQSRLRVDAEIVRDVALCASGKLAPRIGGPSVHPPQPDGVYNFTQRAKSWRTDTGDDRYRRGMYTFFYRSAPYPMLTTFDAPNMNTSCTRRVRSNTPLQSLTLANSEAMFELAQAMAVRVLKEVKADDAPAKLDAARIGHAFRLALSREPAAKELARLKAFLNQQRARFSGDADAAKAVAPADAPADAPAYEAAAWVALSRALMNVDEFITRE